MSHVRLRLEKKVRAISSCTQPRAAFVSNHVFPTAQWYGTTPRAMMEKEVRSRGAQQRRHAAAAAMPRSCSTMHAAAAPTAAATLCGAIMGSKSWYINCTCCMHMLRRGGYWRRMRKTDGNNGVGGFPQDHRWKRQVLSGDACWRTGGDGGCQDLYFRFRGFRQAAVRFCPVDRNICSKGSDAISGCLLWIACTAVLDRENRTTLRTPTLTLLPHKSITESCIEATAESGAPSAELGPKTTRGVIACRVADTHSSRSCFVGLLAKGSHIHNTRPVPQKSSKHTTKRMYANVAS